MKIITEWKQLQHLQDSIDQALLVELRLYFKKIVTEMLEQDDYQNYDISEIAYMVILETDDDLNHLQDVGFSEDTMLLTESIAEFVDELELGNKTYYRILVLLGNDEGVMIYAEANTLGEPFEN